MNYVEQISQQTQGKEIIFASSQFEQVIFSQGNQQIIGIRNSTMYVFQLFFNHIECSVTLKRIIRMPDGLKIQNNKVVQNQTCQSYTAGYDYFFCSDNKFCAVNLQQGSVKVVKEFDHDIQDFDIEQFNGKVALCFRGQ